MGVLLCFCNPRTERGMEMKLTLIDFARRVAEKSRSSWLQTLGKLTNQVIDRSPYIRYMPYRLYLRLAEAAERFCIWGGKKCARYLKKTLIFMNHER